MRKAQERWWIIGSAAAALHGASSIHASDIDILLSPSDARKILPGLGIRPASGKANSRFWSEIFARWGGASLDLEFMAGLHLSDGGQWRPVKLQTHRLFCLEGTDIIVPELDELKMLFAIFARPKDFERLRLLNALN
ncbi:hypothetical protein D6851_02060 [Altericroceibacterium spongiae]|uniref:Nucleotidyltransferase domain-containing protein n=2 Tax=Altericroceibacterium spongiae TaxID=2320269 RepID=A0A420ERG6_9SPHN|nr:hypothetical protein D6851_02060 [Altericroceibacterium spongiae]